MDAAWKFIESLPAKAQRACLPIWVECIQHSDCYTADYDRLIRILDDIGDRRAVPPLVHIVTWTYQNPDRCDYDTTRLAAKALGNLGDARAVDSLGMLLTSLTGDESRPPRESDALVSTIEALGKIGDRKALEPLLKCVMAFSNADWFVRYEPVMKQLGHALFEIDSKRAMVLLKTKYQPKESHGLLLTLAYAHQSDVVPLLVRRISAYGEDSSEGVSWFSGNWNSAWSALAS